MSEPSSPSAARIWTGLGVVYFFWGTTYLAIDRSNQTIPPLVGPAVRFCLAGAILMGWSRIRHGWRRPTARQWRSAAVVGCLLLLGGNGSVAVAEHLGVDTGIVALIIALVPIWIALIDRVLLRSAPLGIRVVIGLIGGFGGAAVLVGGQVAGHVTVLGLLVAVVASLSWAFGSLYQRGADRGRSPAVERHAAARGWYRDRAGRPVRGQFREMHPSQVSRESALALLYLIVFGSLLTLSCYLWLLRVARTSLVSTYAYVNPVVAVFLGWLVLHEPITAQILVAAAVILASVAMIVSAAGAARDRSSGEDRRTKVEAEIGFES
jgi:drug/metabolite transporter (DMT)-like permease